MTHSYKTASVPPDSCPECKSFQPMKETEAKQYLEQNGFLEEQRFRSGKLFSAAMGLASLFGAVFKEEDTERFLDAVFDEDIALATRFVPEAYRILHEPVPNHLLALAAFPDIWSELISVTACLVEDPEEPDPSGPGRTARIAELLRTTNECTIPKDIKKGIV